MVLQMLSHSIEEFFELWSEKCLKTSYKEGTGYTLK